MSVYTVAMVSTVLRTWSPLLRDDLLIRIQCGHFSSVRSRTIGSIMIYEVKPKVWGWSKVLDPAKSGLVWIIVFLFSGFVNVRCVLFIW